MAVHGVPRATGALDAWVQPTAENAKKVYAALEEFGVPLLDHGGKADDFTESELVYQIGQPPRRIDILTSLSGLNCEEAWRGRLEVSIAGLRIPFLGRGELIRNKKATGREKDLLDAKTLEAKPGS